MIDTRKFEGLRLSAYKDSKGYWTIGYGHNLQGGADRNLLILGLSKSALLNGQDLTLEQAEALFELDMSDVKHWIVKLVPNFADQPELIQKVLLDLGFNMGQGTLSQFRNTLKAFIKKDYETAANGLENSLWYTQVKSRGVAIVEAVRSV